MTTREKILGTALILFNNQGTDATTTRHIANKMNISHGNLCYHFTRKEEIIKELYGKLVTELDETSNSITTAKVSISLLKQSISQTFEVQIKYKFILMEFVKIMRLIPEVSSHFKTLYQKRIDQFLLIISLFGKEGYFLSESYPKQYENLIKQFYIIGDFWISEAEILFTGTEEQKVEYYSRLSLQFFYPYLTEKGQREITPYFQ
jgi:hypothetical protein